MNPPLREPRQRNGSSCGQRYTFIAFAFGDYPQNVTGGQSQPLVAGIGNHEHEQAD